MSAATPEPIDLVELQRLYEQTTQDDWRVLVAPMDALGCYYQQYSFGPNEAVTYIPRKLITIVEAQVLANGWSKAADANFAAAIHNQWPQLVHDLTTLRARVETVLAIADRIHDDDMPDYARMLRAAVAGIPMEDIPDPRIDE